MNRPQPQSLSARLDALTDELKATIQLSNRLAQLSFQPGSLPPEGEGDVRTELSSDIHENLKRHEEDFELLKQEVVDYTGNTRSSQTRRESERSLEKSRLDIQVARLGEDLKQARSRFRKAQLTSKRNADLAKRKERELRLSSFQDPSNLQHEPASNGDQEGPFTPTSLGGPRRGGRHQKPSEDEVLVNASSDVTAALRQTHQLMLAELERSRFAQETLERGTAQLKQLDEQYTSLDTLLASSRSLLSTLVTSRKSDSWYLETAFWILVCTCGWLFFRRILYGPLWLFIVWPVKLGFRLLLLILSAIGLTGASPQATPPSSLDSIQASLGSAPSIYATMASNQAQGDVHKRKDDGAKRPDPSLDDSLTQQIGQMIEKTQEADKDDGGRKEEDQVEGKEPVTRGDGTVLRERGDIPPNPKKRVFDVNQERDEL